ncbi:pentapeptide repeat-containing protein [Streptomyces avidinii]|uniref:pentapeptide repeat-containing protein n=1 Tax=Streptomyces avidinii TaxID=1895 RepID=UPI003788E008|nr:pentapeptide repeat-containing protein [Streptomyces avidinii]
MQWVGLVAVSLPGLAALGALLFTWMQVGQASKELRISEHGQITSRFNAAVGNLGSQSLDIRLGGIYALQRIMQDSVRDHPTVVSVLAAFAQQHAGSSTKSLKEPLGGTYDHAPKPDVQAAIATLARRDADRDAGAVIDLSNTDLRGLRFPGKTPIALPGVSLNEADLRNANLNGAVLRRADLQYANLDGAELQRADLTGVHLAGASLGATSLKHANLRGADVSCGGLMIAETGETERTDCVDLEFAILDGADLRDAKMSDTNLSNATLTGADLRGADLTRANLTNADFRGAKLAGAKLHGVKRTGALGLPHD